MSELPRKVKMPSGDILSVDFSEDECERRMNEVIRRVVLPRSPAYQKPTFNLETGQPFEGPQLSADELRRRGYDVPERK